MSKELFWVPKPILCLINEFDYGGSDETSKTLISPDGLPTIDETDELCAIANWHGSGVATIFNDTAIDNIIKFTVRFKSKTAYGKFAKYLLIVERWENNSWNLEIRDPVCYCTEGLDRLKWYYWEREYGLLQTIDLIKYTTKQNTTLKFRITAYVAIARNSSWSSPQTNEFVAILNAPKLKIIKEYLKYQKEFISQYERVLQK